MVKKKRTGFFARFKTSRYADEDEDGSTLTKQNKSKSDIEFTR